MPRIAGRRILAPGPSTQVDWSNTLSTGLQGVGIGTDEWTHIPRLYSAALTTNTLTRTKTPWGTGIRPADFITRCVEHLVFGALPDRRTVMVWVGLESTSQRGYAFGFSGLNGSTYSGVGCGSNDFGTDGNEMLGKDAGAVRDTNTNIGAGFHSLAMTSVNGATADYFIDGTFVANLAQTSTSNSSPHYFEVGGYQPGLFNEFRSIIGPWAAWNRCLSPAEVAKLHADPFQMLRR